MIGQTLEIKKYYNLSHPFLRDCANFWGICKVFSFWL